MKKNKTAWTACSIGVVVLCILAFSPLIIPTGKSEPLLWGIPRTLWAGILVYALIVVLTFIGTHVHPDIREQRGDTQ
jgi:hypothetical protein